MAKIKFPDKHLAEIREFYEEELVKTKRRLKHIKSVLSELVDKQPASKKPARRGRPPKQATTTTAPKRRGRPPKKTTDTVASTTPKRRGRPPKQTSPAAQPSPVKKTPGKAGRKSKWDKIIVERLTAINKPVTYEELTDDVMKTFKHPASKRPSTKQAIVNVIFRMRNRNDHVDTISLGSREKYVVLKTWYSSPGKLKAEFADKVKTTDAEASKAPVKKPAAKKAPARKASTATAKKTAAPKTTGRKRGRPPKSS